MSHRLLIVILATVMLTAPGWSADLIGRASVIDGDTLEIHGQSIRLVGIDAPESIQLCESDGRQYRCGQKAALALADHIGQRIVRCEGRDTDRYGRIVAICWVDDEDLGAWLTRQGFAVAFRRYSIAYVNEESEAKAAHRGIWCGSFVMPWAWRAGERLPREDGSSTAGATVATPSEPHSCLIKGNISKKGVRIYHLPGQQNYVETEINESKGERWFCTEAEATAGGWRKAKK